MVRPYFRSRCPVLENAGVTAFEHLQKLQAQGAKFVNDSPLDANALPVIRALKRPTATELLDFEGQKMVCKSLNGDRLSYMIDAFVRVNKSFCYKSRSSFKATVIRIF